MHKYTFLLLTFFFFGGSLQAQDPTVQPFLEQLVLEFPTVRDIAISPNGDEVLFTAQSPMGDLSVIMLAKKEKGVWSSPKVAPFSGKDMDLEPAFSPDGLSLYFASNRQSATTDAVGKNMDIWVSERKKIGDEWPSNPWNLGYPINTPGNEFYPSVASNNNLYFTSNGPLSMGKDDIILAPFDAKKDRYSELISLGESINTEGYEFNAYVAPDESFLIFSGYNRKDGLGSGDLYISYQENGKWAPAKNLGAPYNSNKMDYCPFVDVKNKTLYFTSKRNKINTDLDKRLNKEELLKLMTQYENGLSRLYQVSFEAFLKE